MQVEQPPLLYRQRYVQSKWIFVAHSATDYFFFSLSQDRLRCEHQPEQILPDVKDNGDCLQAFLSQLSACEAVADLNSSLSFVLQTKTDNVGTLTSAPQELSNMRHLFRAMKGHWRAEHLVT